VKGQKKEEGKPIEVEGIEEWEVEKILNKRKIRGVEKYLVQWKGFTAEEDTWERKKDLKNVGEALEEFKRRMNAEVRRLYGWDDGKFEEEYLKKLERNWRRWKTVSLEEKP